MMRDSLHHVAIECDNIRDTAYWYTKRFMCTVEYMDESWALLKFENINLALTRRNMHPPHIAIKLPAWMIDGQTIKHRDGTESVYVLDPSGNAVELLKINE